MVHIERRLDELGCAHLTVASHDARRELTVRLAWERDDGNPGRFDR